MRASDDSMWSGLREHLRRQGYDPDTSAVGQLFPEDTGLFGVAVTHDHRAYTFVIDPRDKVIEWDERTDADSRFAYARNIFAAMRLLGEPGIGGGRPLDVLVDYVSRLTRIFRGSGWGTSSDRWRADDYWKVLHGYMLDQGSDPRRTAAIEWSWTGSKIDGALVLEQGTVIHFIGSLRTIHGPIDAVLTWNALTPEASEALYGELIDAGKESLRRELR
jgi:hypothetical protein